MKFEYIPEETAQQDFDDQKTERKQYYQNHTIGSNIGKKIPLPARFVEQKKQQHERALTARNRLLSPTGDNS